MTKEELQDIKTRYETVTPKDWNLDVRVGCLAVYAGEKINCMADLEKDKTIYYSDGYRDNEGVWQNYTEKENTASFIAHSITDIPKLIDEIEHLQSENEQLQLQLTAKETTLNGTYIDINSHYRDIKKPQSENTRLKAELDKAVEDLENLIDCHCACNYCANLMPDGTCEAERKYGACTCLPKWRGLEE